MNTENLNKIKKLDYGSKSGISVCLLAILGDKEIAFVLIDLMFDAVCLVCGTCGEYNEKMVISDSPKEIVPINNNQKLWDGNDLSDTYLCFSSVLELFENETDAHALKYYYGTYTCPKCGRKMNAMDGVKRYFRGE